MAVAQMPVTPNLGLQLPPPHYTDWNIPLNTNSVILDTWSTSVAPKFNPIFTGIITLPITGSIQCLQVSTSGVLSGTGSPCGSGGGGITLTTTGSSGPATLNSGVLNIPVYSSGGGGTPASPDNSTQINLGGTFGSSGVMQLFFPTTQTETQTFTNSGLNTSGNANYFANVRNYLWNWQQASSATNGSAFYEAYGDNISFSQPGYSLGDHWSITGNRIETVTGRTRGIFQNDSLIFSSFKFGDTSAHETGIVFSGGANADNDEGLEGNLFTMSEALTPFGTIVSSSPTSNGGTAIVGNWTNGGNLGDVAYQVSTSEILASGNVTSVTTSSGNTLAVQTTSDSHAISNGYATLSGSCGAGQVRNSPVSTPCAITLVRGSFNAAAGQTVCVGDPGYPEQVAITAASSSSLTLGLAYVHPSGVHLFQGGTCGGKQNFDVNLISTHTFLTYWVAGSNSATTQEVMVLNKGTGGGHGPSVTGAYHDYCGAENVQPPSVSTVYVEPNNCAWTVGQNIENPHFYTQQLTVNEMRASAFTPISEYINDFNRYSMGGAGFSAANYFRLISLDNPNTVIGLGGSTVSPHIFVNSSITNPDHLAGFADIQVPIPTNLAPWCCANGFIFRIEELSGTETVHTFSLFQILNANSAENQSWFEYNEDLAGFGVRGINDFSIASDSTIELDTNTAADLTSNGSEICTMATGCGGGSGTVTHTAGALTTNSVVIGNGSADIKIDTGCSTDGSGHETCASFASNGSTNGAILLTATGTPPSSAPTSTIQIETPNSVTAYGLELPAAQPSTTGQYLTCTAANPSFCSWSQIVGTGTQPTIAPGAGAGTGGTAAVDAHAHDSSGTITVILGSIPTSGTVATLTFGSAFSTAPHCVMSPGSSASALNGSVTFNVQSTTTATLSSSSAVSGTSGDSLVWNYACQQ